MALIAGCFEEVGEAAGICHRLVIGAIEGDRFEPAGALHRELRGRAALGFPRAWRPGLAAGRAPQRVVVIVLFAPLRRGRGGHALGELRAETLRHAAEQRGEFELAHEGGERFGLGRAHRSLGQFHVERHLRVENDQHLGQPRLVGEGYETLAPLVLLDLGRAGEQRFEIAELVDEEGRGLNPDARHARNVVG